MNQDALKKLEDKVTVLEKKRNFNLWLQFFIFPLLLAGMGYYFQHNIKESEKRMEQLKVAQLIVNQVFNDSIKERTVIIRDILDEVLENNALADKIQNGINGYLKNRAENGTPEETKEILKALEISVSTDTTFNDVMLKSTKVQENISIYNRASTKEQEGFAFLSLGELENAKNAFKKAESIYPSFHQVYEIYKYLQKHEHQFDNASKVAEIQQYIANNFSWKAPKEFIQRFR